MSIRERIGRLERAHGHPGASTGLTAYRAAAARNWARGDSYETFYRVLVPEPRRASLAPSEIAGWDARVLADRERRAELLCGDSLARAAADLQTERRWLEQNRTRLDDAQRRRLADLETGRLYLEGMSLKTRPSAEMQRLLGDEPGPPQ